MAKVTLEWAENRIDFGARVSSCRPLPTVASPWTMVYQTPAAGTVHLFRKDTLGAHCAGVAGTILGTADRVISNRKIPATWKPRRLVLFRLSAF